jgi:hypothetical protein
VVVPDEFLPEKKLFYLFTQNVNPRSRGGPKKIILFIYSKPHDLRLFEGQIRRSHTLLIIRAPKGDLPRIGTHL